MMPPTQANPHGNHGYGEPPTMAAARARIHEIARELPSDNRFGGSSGRHQPSYEPQYQGETQGRIDDGDLVAARAAYDRQFGNQPAPYSEPGGAYSQPYSQPLSQQDPYEAAPRHAEPWPTNDPMTELRPSYDEALARHEERYGSDHPNHHDHRSDRPVSKDDNSGQYERRPNNDQPSSYNSNSYDAAAYEANYPKAPRQEPSYVGRGESFRSASPPQSDDFHREEPREEERRPSFRRDPPRQHEEERRPSYQPPRVDETRAEGTGGRGQRENAWSEPPAREPEIPGPARIPQELRVPEGFVMGVQPIRTPNMGGGGSYPPPQAVIASISQQPRSYGPPGGPATMAASPSAMPMNPHMPMGAFGPMTAASMNPMMPMIAQPPAVAMPGSMMNQMHVRAHTSMRPGAAMGSRAPQMTEVEEAQQGSKIGRFAWFVFGAAFGIFFAFAATGFGFGKKEEAAQFPAPSTLPAPTQTQAQPQQPVQQPMVVAQQPMVAAQQPMMVAQQPMVAQQQPMVVQQQPMVAQQQPMMVAQQPMIAAPPATGIQAVAPPPQVVTQPVAQLPTQPVQQQQVQPPRPQPQRRPAPSRRPRPAQPATDDDDAPPPPKKAAAPVDANDILGAGI